MAKAKMIVFTRALGGEARTLDDWYETTHGPDLLAIPGVVGMERFDISLAMSAPEGAPQWDALAIYELEADDIGAVVEEMTRRKGTSRMMMTPVLDSANTLAVIAASKAKP